MRGQCKAVLLDNQIALGLCQSTRRLAMAMAVRSASPLERRNTETEKACSTTTKGLQISSSYPVIFLAINN